LSLRNALASGLSRAQTVVLFSGELKFTDIRVAIMELIEVFDFEEFHETTREKISLHVKASLCKLDLNPYSPRKQAA
jgi:hypothetical protein